MRLLLNHGRIIHTKSRKKMYRVATVLGFTILLLCFVFDREYFGEKISKEMQRISEKPGSETETEISIVEEVETMAPENESGFIIDAPQCLWGTWRVTQMFWEGPGFEDCEDWDEMKNLEITFLPDKICFEGKTKEIYTYSSRLSAVYRGDKGDGVILPAYPESEADSYGIEGNYVLQIYLKSVMDSEEDFLPAYFYRLISDDEMIVKNANLKHKAVKIKDIEVEEEVGFEVGEPEDICNGTWEIVEEIEPGKDSIDCIGDVLDVRVWNENGIERTGMISECRVFSSDNEKVKDIAEKCSIADRSSLVVYYRFADSVGWDGMIVKDPMNVILVKENAFYLAKRISDPKGKDMIYEQSI